MRVALISIVVAVAGTFGLVASGAGPTATGDRGPRQAASSQSTAAVDVERTERELIAGITARDLVAYDRIVADDYVALTVEGTETTKQEVMASYKAGTRRYGSLAIHDVKVRVFGDAAVLSARTTGVRVEAGKEVPNHVRYVRVYALRDGRWRAVMQMAAPIPAR